MIQRFYGIISGVLLWRALDSLAGCISAMALPYGEISVRVYAAVPPFIVFVFSTVFGVLYLRGTVSRWMHWVMMILQGLGALFITAVAVFPFFTESKVSGMRGSMVASGSTKLLLAIGLIYCAARLLREQSKETIQVLPPATTVDKI